MHILFKGRNLFRHSYGIDHELARNAHNSCLNFVLFLLGNFNVLASCSKLTCLRTQKKGVLNSNFKSRGNDEKIFVGDRSFAHFLVPLRNKGAASAASKLLSGQRFI